MFQACLQLFNSNERALAAIEGRKQKWLETGLTHISYNIDEQLIPYKTKTLLSEDIIKKQLDPLKLMNRRLYETELQKYPGDDEAKQLINKAFKKAQKLISSQEQLATIIFKKQLVTMELNPASSRDELTKKVKWAEKTAQTKYDLEQVREAASIARSWWRPRPMLVFANAGYGEGEKLKRITENKVEAVYSQLTMDIKPDDFV